jgi:AbrB family looped-hinge helix DNA binding protein
VHVVKVSAKGQIVIPKEVRKRHRIGRNTNLVLLESGDALVLREQADMEEILEGGFGLVQRAWEEALKELWDNPEDDVWNRV